MSPEEISCRAEKGARFLDERNPGWERKITRPIKVASTHECPLAQLYTRYRDGTKILNLSDNDALELGFRGDHREIGTTAHASRVYYSLLSSSWEREVLKRKK